jgi:manganese/iron transport system substrate-binding protein
MKKALLLACLFALLVASACSNPEPATDATEGKLSVVSTVSPITNIVQNVGGDRISLTGLVPEGANSHEFEPVPRDAQTLAKADILFANGLHLEQPTLELAEANVRKGVPVVKLGERTITPDQYIFDFSFPKASGDPNPHLWTNPPYAKRYSEIVRDELSKLDPEGAVVYRTNQQAFSAQLDKLDAATRSVTATVPMANRKLLTYHDSFPYFAREYGWKIIGAIQPADFAEPTPRDVARLIAQIKREKVPAIFGSEVFPSPVLEQISKESGARYVDKLRDDDLPGSPADPNHSYIGLMIFDFKTFMGALGGDPKAFDDIDVRNLTGDASATYKE